MQGGDRFPRRLAILALCGLWVLAGIGGVAAQEFEAGLLDVSQGSPDDCQPVLFNRPFSSVPVVVLGPLSANHAHGATLRVRRVATTGFEFQVDEWDYLDGAHPSEGDGSSGRRQADAFAYEVPDIFHKKREDPKDAVQQKIVKEPKEVRRKIDHN